MKSENPNLGPSLQMALSIDVMGVLWFSNEKSQTDYEGIFPKYFKHLDYFLDGALSRQGHHPKDRSLYFTGHFERPFFLAQIPLEKGQGAEHIKDILKIVRNEKQHNDRSKILILGEIRKSHLSEIQKSFPQYTFIEFREDN